MGLQSFLQRLRGQLLAGDGREAFERSVERHRVGDTAGAVSALREAAQCEHPEACYLLGSLHLKGEVVDTDVPLAMGLFERAARQGSAKAMMQLGVRYADGDGVERDLGKSRSMMRQAAELGEPVAMGYLGMSYLQGVGGPVDMDLAVNWLRKAADQRHGPARNALAVLYERGQGVAADPAQAFVWFRRAAEVGDVVGQYNLGRAYQIGLGVRPDPAAAARWHLKAAEQGDADAQLAIARSLINARGVKADPTAAAHWLRLAVEQQHPLSMVFLAGLHADGLGVERDPRFATDLLNRARDLGVDVAEVQGLVMGQWMQSILERNKPVDITGADADRPSDPAVYGQPNAKVDSAANTPGDSQYTPSELDRRSCFFAFHLLPEWLFSAPPGRSFDAAAAKPVIEKLWAEAWRLALPYARHNWIAASPPVALDLEVDRIRWLCILMDDDTMPPAPSFMLVQWLRGEAEVWLAELASTGHLLLCQIDREGRHSLLGCLPRTDPDRLAAALTSEGYWAALAESDESRQDTMAHVSSYAEVSTQLEAARKAGGEASSGTGRSN